MTREEFIQGYCERSNVTWDELSKFRAAIPCDCGEEGCHGWQMVSKSYLVDNGIDFGEEK